LRGQPHRRHCQYRKTPELFKSGNPVTAAHFLIIWPQPCIEPFQGTQASVLADQGRELSADFEQVVIKMSQYVNFRRLSMDRQVTLSSGRNLSAVTLRRSSLVFQP
jgi:hypothetical protein